MKKQVLELPKKVIIFQLREVGAYGCGRDNDGRSALLACPQDLFFGNHGDFGHQALKTR